jgi:chromosome segregation ATPase
MNDIEKDYVVEAKAPTWLTGVAIAALLVALGGLAWSMSLQGSLTDAQKNLAAANQQNTQLQAKLEDTNERLKAQGEALGQSVGLTQKQLEDKSNELIASERATAAATKRLQREEKDTQDKVGQVQTDVAGVKTDVSGVKTDVATTQADLADTKTQMGSMKGDMGVMSGLIATNHDQLEELKHRGDRNYYEFTLTKGGPAQNVGTIKLQLKKVDQKRSKYTVIVSSDDHNIEKKDKNIDEPVQFYSGKQPMLFELVVNNISKKQVSGYLSTPKSAPAPISMQ